MTILCSARSAHHPLSTALVQGSDTPSAKGLADSFQMPPPRTSHFTCRHCELTQARERFSPRQMKRSTRLCIECVAMSPQRSGKTRQATTLVCSVCGISLPPPDLLRDSRRSTFGVCSSCTVRKVTVLALGAQCAQCPHCHAKLWTHEQTGFCCQYGKHAINFTTYFRAPSPDLLRLYASSWPLRDLAGNVSRDSKTNADKLTSFSVVSQR